MLQAIVGGLFICQLKIFYVHMFIVISITDGPMILTPFLSELILSRARRWGVQQLHLTCSLQVGPVKKRKLHLDTGKGGALH